MEISNFGSVFFTNETVKRAGEAPTDSQDQKPPGMFKQFLGQPGGTTQAAILKMFSFIE